MIGWIAHRLFHSPCLSFRSLFLWRSTKEVKIFCPTKFVVDATENSKEGGVAAEVCSSQTGLWTKSKRQHIALTWFTKMKSLFSSENLRTLSNQHHPPPNISVWSDARQRKTVAKWVGGYRSVGVDYQGKTKTPRSNNKHVCAKKQNNNNPKRKKSTIHTYQQLHQVETKFINHNTKCKGMFYWWIIMSS